jgi:hypothetical protein
MRGIELSPKRTGQQILARLARKQENRYWPGWRESRKRADSLTVII